LAVICAATLVLAAVWSEAAARTGIAEAGAALVAGSSSSALFAAIFAGATTGAKVTLRALLESFLAAPLSSSPSANATPAAPHRILPQTQPDSEEVSLSVAS